MRSSARAGPARSTARTNLLGDRAHRLSQRKIKTGMTAMAAAQCDFAPLLPAGWPAAAAKWTGLAKYSFIGGNNDPDQVPVEGLIDAVNSVLRREGKALAPYGLASGPPG